MDDQRESERSSARGEEAAPPEGLLPRRDSGFVPPGARPAPPARITHGVPDGSPGTARGHRDVPRSGEDEPADPDAFPGTERVDRAAVLEGEGYTSARPRNDPLAVAALVLGIAGLAPLVGVGAVVCGHVALRRLRSSNRGGAGLAVAGLVLGYTLTALWVLFYLATRALPA